MFSIENVEQFATLLLETFYSLEQATKTDAEGELAVGIGALKTAPKSWKKGAAVAVSGLWVYARKPPNADSPQHIQTQEQEQKQKQKQGQEQEQPGPTAAHVCDPQTGVDSKHGQCLRVAACNKATLGQQFERFPCSHWADRSNTDGSGVPLPAGKCTSNPP